MWGGGRRTILKGMVEGCGGVVLGAGWDTQRVPGRAVGEDVEV